MKKTAFILFFLLAYSTLVISQVIITDETDPSDPDPSAMLEIRSSDKGVLIPRLTAAQRTTLTATAVAGLLVYQDDVTEEEDGFYFFNGTAWLCLNASISGRPDKISDADNDTKIQVEATPDEDSIRFEIGGTEYFRMGNGRIEVLNTGNSVFLGNGAGANDDLSDNKNVAIGDSALFSNTVGHYNTAIGYNVLPLSTSGIYNTALGARSMYKNTTGQYNTAIGHSALESNTEGHRNTALGISALINNISGVKNTATGRGSLSANTTGDENTASGNEALSNNTTGSYNTAVGQLALGTNTEGNYNTTFGYNADVGDTSLVNATAIGANAYVGQSNSLVLGSIEGVNGATNDVNVGIGTSSPDESAILELKSTTKGFLPPRMTEQERDDIDTPATGLIIYQTNGTAGLYQYNGTTWAAISATTLSIGDTHAGGIIFYLDASGHHGLVCASSDQSGGIYWYNGSYVNTYAYGNGIGAGEGNSQGIRQWQGQCSSCYASELCQDLSLEGYTDWYLPSKYELNLMYENVGQGNALGLGNVGGFVGTWYWSSSEYGLNYAWIQFFFNGIQSHVNKYITYRVRAVRAF